MLMINSFSPFDIKCNKLNLRQKAFGWEGMFFIFSLNHGVCLYPLPPIPFRIFVDHVT